MHCGMRLREEYSQITLTQSEERETDPEKGVGGSKSGASEGGEREPAQACPYICALNLG